MQEHHTMEASADADHLCSVGQNLREIDALRIANRKANDANKLLQQDISGRYELEEAKALMAISIPRARLWWLVGAKDYAEEVARGAGRS